VRHPDGTSESYASSRVPFTLGRDPHCDATIDVDGISREHLMVYFDSDAIVLRDRSRNGCLVGGKPMPKELKTGKSVSLDVQGFDVHLEVSSAPAAITLRDETTPEDTLKVKKETPKRVPPPAPTPPPPEQKTKAPAPEPVPEPKPGPDLDILQFEAPVELPAGVQDRIHRRLLDHLNLKGISLEQVGSAKLRSRSQRVLDEILDEELPPTGLEVDRPRLRKTILDEVFGLGPLEAILADDSISEIMVVGKDRIFVEKSGHIRETNLRFTSEPALYTVIQRIVGPIGRHVDEGSPLVDARLRDGSRVNVIIRPISLSGSVITIRKFSEDSLCIDDLIRFGSLTQQMADFLRVCVLGRKNIVVAGGTGSGKTTLLNVLGDYIRTSERIVTIEDSAELRLKKRHVVTLEARPANLEGRGAITIRDLVKNALRMRPDRIIVGECRGGEALDMLQAMNTGHDGSLTTVHANSPEDVISRLETMVLMAGTELPASAIRNQIASAIDLVIYQARLADGSRRVMEVTEVVEVMDDEIRLEPVFSFVAEGRADDGRIRGSYRSSGHMPSFVVDLVRLGLVTEEDAIGIA